MIRRLVRVTALVAGALWMPVLSGQAADCGCEPPACAPATCGGTTVCHVHRHCYWGRSWHHGPPPGMVVQSAPMMAAPMMAAPMMAAPMMAAPMMAAPAYALAAPSYSYAPVQAMAAAPQATIQFALVRAPDNAPAAAPAQDQSDRLMRALAQALGGGCNAGNGAASGLQAPQKSLDDRVTDLEQRVTQLERMTTEIVDVLKDHSAQLKSGGGK